MGEYDAAVALTARLVTKKGQSVTLRSFTAGAPADASKPWKPGSNAAVDQTVDAVFLDYAQDYIDGDMVRQGDQRVFIAASGLSSDPEVEGVVVRGSEVWKIITVRPLNPGGQKIMFELQVRQ